MGDKAEYFNPTGSDGKLPLGGWQIYRGPNANPGLSPPPTIKDLTAHSAEGSADLSAFVRALVILGCVALCCSRVIFRSSDRPRRHQYSSAQQQEDFGEPMELQAAE